MYILREVHEQYQVKLRKLSPYVIWLQFSTALGRLLIGNVYDPQNSNAMQEVYDGLLSDINTLKASGAHVVCIGDYNAHVGSLDDRVLDPSGQPFGVASRRGSDPHAVNAFGELMLDHWNTSLYWTFCWGCWGCDDSAIVCSTWSTDPS